MICICCLSRKIKPEPLGLTNYFYCQACGLIFHKTKINDDKQNSIAAHYQNDDPHREVANSKRSFFEYALAYLSTKIAKKRRNIIDIGCGYGYFLKLAQKKGWATQGVEITDYAATTAQKTMGKAKIFKGQLKQANYPVNSFNAITMWDVLFLVDDPEDELRECFRVLEPGGIVGVRVRNVWFQKIVYYTHRPFKSIGQKLGFKYPSVFHPYCFSSSSINSLLMRLGFSNIQIINSPLTVGDPYGHIGLKGIVKISKHIIYLFSILINPAIKYMIFMQHKIFLGV